MKSRVRYPVVAIEVIPSIQVSDAAMELSNSLMGKTLLFIDCSKLTNKLNSLTKLKMQLFIESVERKIMQGNS